MRGLPDARFIPYRMIENNQNFPVRRKIVENGTQLLHGRGIAIGLHPRVELMRHRPRQIVDSEMEEGVLHRRGPLGGDRNIVALIERLQPQVGLNIVVVGNRNDGEVQ